MSERSINYVTKFVMRWIAPFLSAHAIKPLPKFFTTHLINLIDLVVNDLYYEYVFTRIALIVLLFIKLLEAQTELK